LKAHSKADLETLEELLATEFVDHGLLLPAMTQGTRDSYTQ
jgi:hypothetical protein